LREIITAEDGIEVGGYVENHGKSSSTFAKDALEGSMWFAPFRSGSAGSATASAEAVAVTDFDAPGRGVYLW